MRDIEKKTDTSLPTPESELCDLVSNKPKHRDTETHLKEKSETVLDRQDISIDPKDRTQEEIS